VAVFLSPNDVHFFDSRNNIHNHKRFITMTPKTKNDVANDEAFAKSLQAVEDEKFAKAEENRIVFQNCPSKLSQSNKRSSSTILDKVSKLCRVQKSPSIVPVVKNAKHILVPKNTSQSHHKRDQQSAKTTSTARPQKTQHARKHLAAELSDGSSEYKSNNHLLYVPCTINDVVCEMMVDTGAAMSVISEPLMNKMKLGTSLNTKNKGVAVGVGSARILGHLHNCPIQIGDAEFLLYFAVLEQDSDMLILGVDQLRRFNCLVDLQNNKLVFGGHGGVEVNFFVN